MRGARLCPPTDGQLSTNLGWSGLAGYPQQRVSDKMKLVW
jgi:hypothetical protein